MRSKNQSSRGNVSMSRYDPGTDVKLIPQGRWMNNQRANKGEKMKGRLQCIRLVTSCVCGSIVFFYIWLHSIMALKRFNALFPGGNLINLCRFFLDYSAWLLVIPLFCFVLGLVTLSKKRHICFTIILAIQYLSTLFFFLLESFAWMLQEVPKLTPRGPIW